MVFKGRCGFIERKFSLMVHKLSAKHQYVRSCTMSSILSSTILDLRRNYSSLSSCDGFVDKTKTTIRLSDYDIIGFDLDNTLLRYNIHEMTPLVYTSLISYLIKNHGYTKDLMRPIDEYLHLYQKGLFLDTERGNILHLSANGLINRAYHGTRCLTNNEVIGIYGIEGTWNIGRKYSQDPLGLWNGPSSHKVRSLLDTFDSPVSLVFARAVDYAEHSKKVNVNNIWPQILSGCIQLYDRAHFASGVSEYFQALKNDTNRYVLKTSPTVVDWLKQLKTAKTTYLLTGSHIDFANLTASYALGENWQELFDIVVCFARKPGFFTLQNKFFEIRGTREIGEADSLQLNRVYSQGNWSELKKVLSTKFNVKSPKCLYVGDNVLQDVYTPVKHTDSRSICVAEELLSDLEPATNKNHFPYKSETWGSYFGSKQHMTLWASFIEQYATICVPTVEYLAKNPICHTYSSFRSRNGFHPVYPKLI